MAKAKNKEQRKDASGLRSRRMTYLKNKISTELSKNGPNFMKTVQSQQITSTLN